MKIRVWCDSGANIHSRYEATIDLEHETGISPEDWAEMSEEAKEEEMKEIAWRNLEWGFEEVEE